MRGGRVQTHRHTSLQPSSRAAAALRAPARAPSAKRPPARATGGSQPGNPNEALTASATEPSRINRAEPSAKSQTATA